MCWFSTIDLAGLGCHTCSHALFVDPANVAAVTEAINHLVTTPDEPESRHCRTRWARRYQWSRHADDFLAIYREVVE